MKDMLHRSCGKNLFNKKKRLHVHSATKRKSCEVDAKTHHLKKNDVILNNAVFGILEKKKKKCILVF